MNNLTFKKFTKKDSKQLIDFLTSQTWKFHSNPKLSIKDVQTNIDKRKYTNREQITFLIYNQTYLIGVLQIKDLINDLEESPEFDIRISSKFHKKGYGTQIINYMIEYIFKNYDKIKRIEGNTREDNIAMQRLFEKCKFTRVAQLRKCWFGDDKYYDTIVYDLLKEESNF